MRRMLVAIAMLVATPTFAQDIVINTKARTLTYAGYVFPVAVGKPTEQWKGVQRVTAKRQWPDWRPTLRVQRMNRVPPFVKGGPGNPLGARALYLGNTLYRIHGTNNPRSIGRAASLGCFRMYNADVIKLYDMVPVGTRVIVR